MKQSLRVQFPSISHGQQGKDWLLYKKLDCIAVFLSFWCCDCPSISQRNTLKWFCTGLLAMPKPPRVSISDLCVKKVKSSPLTGVSQEMFSKLSGQRASGSAPVYILGVRWEGWKVLEHAREEPQTWLALHQWSGRQREHCTPL